jgi:hypothetical protein
MGQMQIMEETSTKMVLHMKASNKLQWFEPIRNIIPALFLGVVFFLGGFISSSSSWLIFTLLKWVFIVSVLLIEITLVCYYLFLRESNVEIVFDLTLQRAIRIDTYLFVRKKQIKLPLEQVNRVLVTVGHNNILLLELANGRGFIVDLNVDVSDELGKKLGKLLGKPAVIKYPGSEDVTPL